MQEKITQTYGHSINYERIHRTAEQTMEKEHVMEELQQEKQFQQITEIHSKRIDHTLAKIRSFWNKLFLWKEKIAAKRRRRVEEQFFKKQKLKNSPDPVLRPSSSEVSIS